MTDPNFSSLLDVQMDDIKPPPTMPSGTFEFIITSQGEGVSEKKETPFVVYEFTVDTPGEDIDTDELPDNWRDFKTNERFYLTKNALFRLKQFLEAAGVKTSGRSLNDAVPEAVGKSVNLVLTQEPVPNTDRFRNRVAGYAPVK